VNEKNHKKTQDKQCQRKREHKYRNANHYGLEKREHHLVLQYKIFDERITSIKEQIQEISKKNILSDTKINQPI